MALIQAVCKSCGANLEFDDNNGNISCNKCGAQYIHENPVSINVNIENLVANDGWRMTPPINDPFSINEKKYAMPFARDERQSKQDWLCKLIEFDDIPLDIAHKATITSIDKEYYPVAFYDITSVAEWQATSIWEHTEKYQVARDVTVYRDYRGREHNSDGRDTEVTNGNVIHHNRIPVHKTVYDTKTQVITDNIERTSGNINATTIPVKVWITEVEDKNINSLFIKWISTESDFIEIKNDYLNSFKVIKETRTIDDSLKLARDYSDDQISNLASSNVPGDRYEDLNVEGEVIEAILTYRYLPVYHIKYTYNSEDYNFYISGGLNDEAYYLVKHPVDNTIAKRINDSKKQIGDAKRNKWLWLVGGILSLFAFPFLLIIPLLLSLIPTALGLDPTAAEVIGYIIASLISLGFLGFTIYKFVKLNEMANNLDESNKAFLKKNKDLKKRIYDLIQDDSIPDDGKGATIANWINEINQ